MADPYRFAPAAPDEPIVHGAAGPGWGATGPGRDATGRDPVADWIDAMDDRGVERVCCLLSPRQVERFDDLLGRYREAFGAVRHAPIPDHHLAEPATLREEVLPFLRAADDRGERTVVHCRAGIGRTGHVLAAWLVHARGHDREAAIEAVGRTGRDPREAVVAGNATDEELLELLAAVAE